MSVAVGDEPWEEHDKGWYIRFRGKTWLVVGINISAPPARCVVELLEQTPQEGDEVRDWHPRSAAH